MKAMILAAGLGTRLKPFTEKHPKALVPVNNKPALQRNIEYLKSFGVQEIIINVHHFAQQIIDFIHLQKNFDIRIEISNEEDEVLETGGGLQKASWFFDDNKAFVLMNADILTTLDLKQMFAYHESKQSLATLAISQRESSRNLLFDDEMKLCGWRNNKTMEEIKCIENIHLTPYAFSGIHIISPAIFEINTLSGKFSMIDMYLMLAKKHTFMGYDHSQDLLMDIGSVEKLKEAEKYFL
ncbi:MAG: nucleotidyltransferase family protein [Chitinophagaceae bacterium]